MNRKYEVNLIRNSAKKITRDWRINKQRRSTAFTFYPYCKFTPNQCKNIFAAFQNAFPAFEVSVQAHVAKQLTDVCVFVLHQTKGGATEKNNVFDRDQEVYIGFFCSHRRASLAVCQDDTQNSNALEANYNVFHSVFERAFASLKVRVCSFCSASPSIHP